MKIFRKMKDSRGPGDSSRGPGDYGAPLLWRPRELPPLGAGSSSQGPGVGAVGRNRCVGGPNGVVNVAANDAQRPKPPPPPQPPAAPPPPKLKIKFFIIKKKPRTDTATTANSAPT